MAAASASELSDPLSWICAGYDRSDVPMGNRQYDDRIDVSAKVDLCPDGTPIIFSLFYDDSTLSGEEKYGSDKKIRLGHCFIDTWHHRYRICLYSDH